MKITELLRTEHAAFNTILNEIEIALPSVATLGEVRILVSVMAGFLQQHGRQGRGTPLPGPGPNAGPTRATGRDDPGAWRTGPTNPAGSQENKDLNKARQQLGQLIEAVRQHFDHGAPSLSAGRRGGARFRKPGCAGLRGRTDGRPDVLENRGPHRSSEVGGHFRRH